MGGENLHRTVAFKSGRLEIPENLARRHGLDVGTEAILLEMSDGLLIRPTDFSPCLMCGGCDLA